MTGLTVAGIVLVLALIIGVGLYSGRRVRNAKDFLTGGGKAGPGLVCGALMGSLVSSQSTLGSVQLAFHYGLAAWWFTLGSGLGCLLMALGYAKALRNSGCVTELQIISGEYGGTVESVGSVLSATGIFITVLSQVMGCIGLFTLMFPSMSVTTAAMLAVLVMCCYVIFGGAWGAGMGGVVKVTLLYLSLMGDGADPSFRRRARRLDGVAGAASGGTPLGLVQQAANNVPNLTGAADISRRFMNLTARGTMKDLGSCVSLLLGVLSTQTYAQAVWSGRTDSDARKGVLLSAFLIPPLGIAGVLMGLSMRAHYLTAAEAAALAAVGQAVPDLPVLASTLHVMPAFAMDHLPPILAGVVLGTLLITVIGGGAGLSLGMATILVKDIYKRFWPRLCTPAGELLATRLTIAVVLIVAAVLSIVIPNKTLNDFGFLSMALRGAVVFAPMTCALALKGRIRSGFILAAIVFAPAAVAAGHFFELPGDPLLTGMGVSVGGCLLGLLFPPHKR
ncbi:sodium:solute symporter family protein [Pyramidobacter sp. YE332]|uniref:sodium:solute symporter family protein n=1 Tax=Pyramidobacter sp. YE332 TaxID=3068894 RepID=UPI00294B0701|nr:sodium:solute symporter family protein [Pyramidobacter sp. YE332]WOL40207.1 sodium:solute symporter family protein [Pyramidobacter sp. YE332]